MQLWLQLVHHVQLENFRRKVQLDVASVLQVLLLQQMHLFVLHAVLVVMQQQMELFNVPSAI